MSYAFFLFIFVINLVIEYVYCKRFKKSTIKNSNHKLVVIIGCDTGVGRLCAIELVKRGFFVCATVLDEKSLHNFDVDETLESNLRVIKLDVTNDDIDYLLEEVSRHIEAKGLTLHAVINNAAITHFGCIEWFEGIQHYKRVMDVNCFGYLRIIKLFLPLCRQHKARIVNILSGCAYISLPGISPYCISKFAVRGLHESLRREMIDHGVKVISIEPCTILR